MKKRLKLNKGIIDFAVLAQEPVLIYGGLSCQGTVLWQKKHQIFAPIAERLLEMLKAELSESLIR